MHCGLSFIAPFCQYANYCKVKWLTDLEGSVRLNHKTTYFPHLHLLQWCADCFARFLAPSFHLMCVNGILFVFSQIFWKVGKNFPEKMLRTIHRPHSQSVSLYSAVKRKLQVHFIYTGHRHKFAFKGFTICKKYDILYPLPIFSYFNTTNQIPLASSVAIQIISFTYLPLKDSTTGKRELVVFFLVIYVN